LGRTFYSNFPNPKDRHRIDDKTRRELRAWYRKYHSIQEQIDHPFETYVPDRSPCQIIREALQAQLEGFQIYINSKDVHTVNLRLSIICHSFRNSLVLYILTS
jgi:hypothetical protein